MVAAAREVEVNAYEAELADQRYGAGRRLVVCRPAQVGHHGRRHGQRKGVSRSLTALVLATVENSHKVLKDPNELWSRDLYHEDLAHTLGMLDQVLLTPELQRDH
ncbi:hypothetical protein ACIRQP_02650 [Streptomyces sp. NPDC102274]|uniref:hypothetical protein n=1 Tax=Streptomyces sp. NPDC102274 TaxID=3366151 RepID=UPI0037F498C8